jgi:uncharacterized protein
VQSAKTFQRQPDNRPQPFPYPGCQIHSRLTKFAKSQSMNQVIISEIVKYFTSQPIQKAWLFGSYARSEESNKSDIDIIVTFIPESNITLFKYIHMVNDLKTLTGKRIDMIEDGQLKHFAESSAHDDKVLIYERETQ